MEELAGGVLCLLVGRWVGCEKGRGQMTDAGGQGEGLGW